jgi:MurNAc alpha-1-phosphate uridylyltransferase
MKCFILAAGFGKRMNQLTKEIPKPLLKVDGFSFLEHSIQFAKNLGIIEFIINTHYHQELIQNSLKNRTDIKIHFSNEKEILGTAGGIKTGIQNLVSKNENLLILNPDSYLKKISESEKENIKNILNHFDKDCFLFLQEKGLEKYTGIELKNDLVYFNDSGIYYYIGLSILKPRILDEIPLFTYSDLSVIFKDLSAKHQLNGGIYKGEVIDLGEEKKYLAYTKDSLPSS